MTLTADLTQSKLIEQLLATERQYGELACGPQFLFDVKLFSHDRPSKSVAGVYKLLKSIYSETPLSGDDSDNHLEALLSTIDRDETSEYWSAKEAVTEIAPEDFSEWMTGCCLAEDYYENTDSENTDGNACEAQKATIAQLTETLRPLLFHESEALKLYTLTDTDNENTPYGVYVAIGKTHTLLVVSHWIL